MMNQQQVKEQRKILISRYNLISGLIHSLYLTSDDDLIYFNEV